MTQSCKVLNAKCAEKAAKNLEEEARTLSFYDSSYHLTTEDLRGTSSLSIQLVCLLLTACLWAQSFSAKPLNDLGSDKYQGFQGGLYEHGTNTVPSDHNAAGLALAAEVKPVAAIRPALDRHEQRHHRVCRIQGDGRRRQPRESQFDGGDQRRQGSHHRLRLDHRKETPHEHGCQNAAVLPQPVRPHPRRTAQARRPGRRSSRSHLDEECGSPSRRRPALERRRGLPLRARDRRYGSRRPLRAIPISSSCSSPAASTPATPRCR